MKHFVPSRATLTFVIPSRATLTFVIPSRAAARDPSLLH
jgi:hypothetical protein